MLLFVLVEDDIDVVIKGPSTHCEEFVNEYSTKSRLIVDEYSTKIFFFAGEEFFFTDAFLKNKILRKQTYKVIKMEFRKKIKFIKI